MPLSPGDPAPWFRAQTPSMPEFSFDAVAGRYVLLAFLPLEEASRHAALKVLAANRDGFDDARLSVFAIVRDAQTASGLRDMAGLRWVMDLEGAVSAQFAAGDGQPPAWVLLDPTLRVMGMAGPDHGEAIFEAIAALPPPAEHGGAVAPAPVLIAPRIFEPGLCAHLVALHQAEARQFTGVMRDRGDETQYVMDELKTRRDLLIRDPGLVTAIHERLVTRLFPLIDRYFAFRPTQVERYLVSCYAAEDGGVFHAHRDNTTFGTAHRAFAASINLNDDFAGGDLRFAEFGPQTYRPPAGGACVFSCGMLHEATRVTSGARYAFLPFFYDEAGAAVLDAYNARTAR